MKGQKTVSGGGGVCMIFSRSTDRHSLRKSDFHQAGGIAVFLGERHDERDWMAQVYGSRNEIRVIRKRCDWRWASQLLC